MRSFEIPTSKAKLKLLDSAEGLVAERGFDAVSVRDVTQLAKANVAAVNYHFGSREGMMSLMMVRRMGPVHQQQLKNLNILEKKRGSKSVPLEEIIEAWLGPLFVQATKNESKDEVLRHSLARILPLAVSELPDPLQESGAEIIHLGHNRSVKDIVVAALPNLLLSYCCRECPTRVYKFQFICSYLYSR